MLVRISVRGVDRDLNSTVFPVKQFWWSSGLVAGCDYSVDWTGLDWTGLDWAGLDWTGLDWNLKIRCFFLH